MNKVLNTTAAIVTLAALAPGLAMANSVEKRVIAIKTNDFELSETDVSDLAVGEAETIVTEDGKTVDILRTAEGLEIYVDGELLDMSLGDKHGAHRLHERKVITCDGAEGDCEDEFTWHSGPHEAGEFHGAVVKKVHVECVSDDESDCTEKMVWVSDDESAAFGEIDIEELIEPDGNIRIIRAHDVDHAIHSEDGELHESHEVIVIREKFEEES